MTSQNSTVRCAASTMYSMAGANSPNGDITVETPACFDDMSSLLRIFRRGSTPAQCHADVARNSPWEVHDLDSQFVATWTEVLLPELVDFLGSSGEGLFPARLLLIDGTPAVRAQLVGKSVDLNLGEPVPRGALDDPDRPRNRLFVRDARWLAELVEQCLFFGLRLRAQARLLRGLLGLGQRNLLHEVLCRWQQCVRLGSHAFLGSFNRLNVAVYSSCASNLRRQHSSYTKCPGASSDRASLSWYDAAVRQGPTGG